MPDDLSGPVVARETIPPAAACVTVISGPVPRDAPQPQRQEMAPPAVVDPAWAAAQADADEQADQGAGGSTGPQNNIAPEIPPQPETPPDADHDDASGTEQESN